MQRFFGLLIGDQYGDMDPQVEGRYGPATGPTLRAPGSAGQLEALKLRMDAFDAKVGHSTARPIAKQCQLCTAMRVAWNAVSFLRQASVRAPYFPWAQDRVAIATKELHAACDWLEALQVGLGASFRGVTNDADCAGHNIVVSLLLSGSWYWNRAQDTRQALWCTKRSCDFFASSAADALKLCRAGYSFLQYLEYAGLHKAVLCDTPLVGVVDWQVRDVERLVVLRSQRGNERRSNKHKKQDVSLYWSRPYEKEKPQLEELAASFAEIVAEQARCLEHIRV